MAEQTIFVFDLGEHLGELMDEEKMRAAFGQEIRVKWDRMDVPGRILSMTKRDGRFRVTVGIDAPLDGLDLGLPS